MSEPSGGGPEVPSGEGPRAPSREGPGVPAGEGPHAPPREGFADWVTFAFGTPDGRTAGVAGLELATGPGGEPRSRGYAVLLADGEGVVARAEAPAPAPKREWAAIEAAGVQATTDEPLARWSVRFRDPGGAGFELQFTALGAPAVLVPEAELARATGLQGHDQLCRVTGTVTSGGEAATVEGLGQRGQRWGPSPAGRFAALREVDLWFDGELAVLLAAARAKRGKPDSDAVSAAVLEGDPPVPSVVDEARLSTTYDARSLPVRASVELWPAPDADLPRRAAGEAIGTATVTLDDRHELVTTFFRWWMEGRAGVGRYALWRPS